MREDEVRGNMSGKREIMENASCWRRLQEIKDID